MKTPSGNAVRRLTSAGGLRRARQADASRSTRDRTLLSRRSTGRMKREDTEKRLRELELFCGLRLVPGAWTLLRLRWARLHPLHRGALREAVRRPPARSHDRRGPGG